MSDSIVAEAATGCHMIFAPTFESVLPNWAGSVSKIDDVFEDYDIEDLPDISIDPDTNCLSFINTSSHARVISVSVQACTCLSLADEATALQTGMFINSANQKFSVTTFIALTPAESVTEVCILKPLKGKSIKSVKVDSHVGDPWVDSSKLLQSASETYNLTTFPLDGPSSFPASHLTSQVFVDGGVGGLVLL